MTCANLVILALYAGIGEDLVGLVDLFEFLFLATGGIGMILFGECSECFFDVLG